jgi:cell wall-associated NlpC family hydrolase
MYLDLLGTPYLLHGRLPRGLDCSTLAEEFLTRLGMTPPVTSPFRVPNSSGQLGEFEDYLVSQRAQMERLGDDVRRATEPGDLVLTSPRQVRAGRGMWVLAEPGLFLTAQPRHGVVAHPVDTVLRARPKILGVYRCRP